MHVEDTSQVFYPVTWGMWERTARRTYTYGNLHYEFDVSKTLRLLIKQRSTLTLSRDGNSFTENGTFEGLDPGDGSVLFSGCFAARAMRPQF